MPVERWGRTHRVTPGDFQFRSTKVFEQLVQGGPKPFGWGCPLCDGISQDPPRFLLHGAAVCGRADAEPCLHLRIQSPASRRQPLQQRVSSTGLPPGRPYSENPAGCE